MPYGWAVPLHPGSYAIRAGPNTQVRVNEGDAEVITARHDLYHLNAGERMELAPAGVTGPLVATEELISNGDFSDGLTGWTVDQAAGFPEGADVPGYYTVVSEDNHNAVEFSRLGSKGTHFETQLTRRVDADVSEYHDLRLSVK